ncbi:hypothetical protein FGG90_09975 [Clavibacter tessellarius]|uniref:Uncharacterized protein n=1 Tax=Clavibacter tessellarius TaxID=31965 RepID=A0A225CMS0_9MICO|nr:hypothetical protein [Clavibacter michiganensis]OQJ62714.1 hypothetical protein B5P24_06745 [Clavibacter michiganensis subsp. tessellarius]UKF34299.1 hypothetical protein FGG90_09975 [Clavibacter michiganensis subsp. tessellarius]
MTLTAILPSLRRSIPDPLAAALWPVGTSATTTDLRVGDVSLVALAAERGTACTVTAAAVEPGSSRRASATARTSALVLRILAVAPATDDAPRAMLVDADIAGLACTWEEARLIGRASTAAARPAEIGGAAVRLPADVVAGDLVVVPVPGAVEVRGIRVVDAAAPVVVPCAAARLAAAPVRVEVPVSVRALSVAR